MELNKYQQEAFDYQRPNIEKFRAGNWAWIFFFLLVIMAGMYAVYHGPDGMRAIAKKIESEMKFPGEVRVTVIRETRTTEYAR